MRAKLFILSILLILVIANRRCFAQTDTLKIISIRTYVKHIDSLIDKNDNSIEALNIEGLISTTKLVYPKGSGKSHKEIIASGGFSETINYSRDKDTVFRISYHDNLHQNFYMTYYYKSNKLICLDVTASKDNRNGEHTVLFNLQEYYAYGSVIFHSVITSKKYSDYEKRMLPAVI